MMWGSDGAAVVAAGADPVDAAPVDAAVAAAGVAVAGSAGWAFVQARVKSIVMIATTWDRSLTLHLRHFILTVARDEVVFLRVVAERAERHLQQLGRLSLHAACALDGLEHEHLADRFEVVLQGDPFGRPLVGQVGNGPAEEDLLGER